MENTYNNERSFRYNDDIALVQLDDWVNVGNNSYSGDSWSKIEDVKEGDKLCAYGARTQKVRCGKVAYTAPENNLIIGDIDTTGINGDSGGPAWIEGKGFVGVYSYSQFINGEKSFGGFVLPSKYNKQFSPQNSTNRFSTGVGKNNNFSSQLSSITKNNEYLPGYIGIFIFLIGSGVLGGLVFNSLLENFLKQGFKF